MLLAINYKGLMFLLKKLMKRIILTTSILALFVSSAMAETTFPITVANGANLEYSNLEYSNNTATYYADGKDVSISPVYVNAGTITIKESTFENNNFSSLWASPRWSQPDSLIFTVNGKAVINVENTTFKANSVVNETGNCDTNGSVLKLQFGTVTFDNVNVESNTTTSKRQVYGNVYVNNPKSASFKNSTFKNNVAGNTDTYNAMGGVITGYEIGKTSIENSDFIGNKAISSSWVRGAAVFARSSDNSAVLNIVNSNFTGNASIQKTNDMTTSLLAWGAGGAVYVGNAYSATIADSTFTNNYLSMEEGPSSTIFDTTSGGGAIHNYNGTLTISASKNITNKGNYTEIAGVKNDAFGGFLFMCDGTTNFAIAQNVTMTIGDGTVGYDSIAGDASSTINKTGAGSLVVNGSMEYFKGMLNVNEGSMVVNSVLGASDIVIASGATLTLGDDTDIILYGCSITVEDGATLELGSNSTITVNLEEDFTGSTNLFNVADGATLTQDGESVTLANLQENMTVTYNGQTLDNSQWSFDTETGELKAAVPEPSTYAAIFGAIALGFVAYRRRK